MLLSELIAGVKARRGVGPGHVRTAIDYLSALAPCLDDGRCRARMAELGDATAWERAIDAAANALVYDDEEMLVEGGIVPAEVGVQTFGEAKGLPGELTAGAVMDFEAVITSSRKDRVGDVLESSGASLDPRSPLLYMHIPFEVTGRLVKQLSQNTQRLTGHLAIIDSPLGQDCARLVEFRALRISHGFRPKKYEPLPKARGGADGGFWIREYDIHEVSLVSVPANIDAVITLHSRGKMLAPINQAWGDHLKRSLPKSVVGGWSGGGTCGCGGGAKGAAPAMPPDAASLAAALAATLDDGEVLPEGIDGLLQRRLDAARARAEEAALVALLG